MPYGVYGPMFTDLSNSSVQYFSASGEILLTSLRVMLSRVRPAGFTGKRLRRPRLIAGRVEPRDRPLLDAEQRLAGQPVEHEQQALLGHLRDGRAPACRPSSPRTATAGEFTSQS